MPLKQQWTDRASRNSRRLASSQLIAQSSWAGTARRVGKFEEANAYV